MEINEYIDNILTDGLFGGDLEISIASKIFIFNVIYFLIFNKY